MASPRLNAVASGGSFAGTDQGFDITGGPFNIFALGNGIITRLERSGSGWPGEGALLVYRLTSGPAAGRYVYTAEDFAPAAGLNVNDPVRAGQVIGQATGSGKAPGIELGFADPAGHAYGSPNGGPNQPMARAFLQLVDQLSAGNPMTGDSLTSPRDWLHALNPASLPSDAAAAAGAVNAGARHIPGVAQAEGAVTGVYNASVSVGTFLGKLTDPNFWIRALQIVGGAFLIATGLYLLAKQVGLATPPAPALIVNAAEA